jgi:hypothetical protein
VQGAIILGIEDLGTVQGGMIYSLKCSSGFKKIDHVYIGAWLYDSYDGFIWHIHEENTGWGE